MQALCESFSTSKERIQACEEFLLAVRTVATLSRDKKTKVNLGGFHFFSIVREPELETLYECLSQLDWESPETSIKLDMILASAQRWRVMQESEIKEDDKSYSVSFNC